MDEEITIIDEKTRNEKIKNFFINNKKTIFSGIIVVVLTIFSFYSFQIYKNSQREQLSEKYNRAVIEFNRGEKSQILSTMKEVIEDKDSTYSPLALYFLIDNNLISNKEEINRLFDILINETSLDYEIKNLIIYKRALYNADDVSEDIILDILKPLINSNSVWKSHALYLIAEYYFSKNEKQKSKEFFNEIIINENSNPEIIKEAQKRLNRDLSE